MIQELSSPQREILTSHIKETIDFVLNNEKFQPDNLKVEDILDDINFLYKKAGLKTLKASQITICDSYADEKKRISGIKDDTTAKEIDNRIFAGTWEIGYKLMKDARQVYQNYINDFRKLDGLQSQIYDVIARLFPNQTESGFGFVYNVNWLSFYSLAIKVGWIDSDEHIKIYNFLRKGIWSIQPFKDCCFVTQMPRKIHRDGERRLHSTESRTIEWRDSGKYKNYYIHGVAFDESLWEKIVTETITVAELLKIDNMEQRMAALSVIPPKKMVDDLNAKLIDTHVQKKRGKEYMDKVAYERIEHKPVKLYKVEDTSSLNVGEPIYVLFYADPSTGREYFGYVQGEHASDSASAMASRLGMTKQQYLNSLIVET